MQKKQNVRYPSIFYFHSSIPLQSVPFVALLTYTAIVHGCHGSEPFLTCCIPDLKSHFTIINHSIRHEDKDLLEWGQENREFRQMADGRWKVCGVNCLQHRTTWPAHTISWSWRMHRWWTCSWQRMSFGHIGRRARSFRRLFKEQHLQTEYKCEYNESKQSVAVPLRLLVDSLWVGVNKMCAQARELYLINEEQNKDVMAATGWYSSLSSCKHEGW